MLIRFSGDTCLALDEYQLNPQKSSLGSILPCSDSANNMLEDVGTGIHNLINQVIATPGDVKQHCYFVYLAIRFLPLISPATSATGALITQDKIAFYYENKVVMSVLYSQVNAEISTVRSSDMPDLEYVCNPFSGPPDYLYQPDNCSSSTINIGDIPQVLILTSL